MKNVLDYGANPNDGDPTITRTAFLATMDAASTGETIHIPFGHYNLDGDLLPTKSVRFKGEGLGSLIHSHGATRLFTISGPDGITVEFEGLRLMGDAVATEAIRASAALTPVNLSLRRVWMDGFTRLGAIALYVVSQYHLDLNMVWLKENRQGAYIATQQNKTTLVAVKALQNIVRGLEIYGTEAAVTHCYFDGSGHADEQEVVRINECDALFYAGNSIDGRSALVPLMRMIGDYDPRGWAILGNDFAFRSPNTSQPCLRIEGKCRDGQIEGNRFVTNSNGATAQSPIQLYPTLPGSIRNIVAGVNNWDTQETRLLMAMY